MKMGKTSTVISADVKREHKEKFDEICKYYNDQEKYFYVPKYEIFQRMIDAEYEKIFVRT
jgi:hypothetical protein